MLAGPEIVPSVCQTSACVLIVLRFLVQASTDIEDPFHDDPNELPLPQIQYKFNERLLAIAHTNRPVSFTDVGEIKGPGNKIQFSSSTPVCIPVQNGTNTMSIGCLIHSSSRRPISGYPINR